MTAKSHLRALLSKGYFPKELPLVFTTSDFGRFAEDIMPEWEHSKLFQKDTKSLGKTTDKKIRRGVYTYKIKNAELEVISKPKRGFERRNIHKTHPVPQGVLCAEVAENWKSVQKWLSKQTYSSDEILVSDEYDRCIRGINFVAHRAKKGYLEATSDWMVKTDITRFYPSIYTHSIVWAAYGKEKVKADLRTYEGSFGSRLDLLVRACNRNQTIGIPIGPETSRILAEIISSRIDDDFRLTPPKVGKENVDRLQDDWIIGTKSLEEAENILSKITLIYREYGLEINGSKTSIDHILANSGTPWISEMSAFLSHKPGRLQKSRLREFLNLCLRLQSENPSQSVVGYALSVIENQRVMDDEMETLESFLLKAAATSPMSMDRICSVLLNLEFKSKSISTKRVAERFIELAERNLERGNLFEAVWLIYSLRGLKKPFVSKRIAELAETTSSSSLALILLDMDSKGLFKSALPKSNWESRITYEETLTSWIWLLAYEGFRHGWLADTSGLMTKPFFEPLAKRGVAFYDPKKNIATSAKIAKLRAKNRRRDTAEAVDFVQFARGLLADQAWMVY